MVAIIYEFNWKQYVSSTTYIKLEGENRKLKSDLAFKNTMLDNVKAEYENLQGINEKLKERIRFLEQCLDNKEKVNKSLREELQRYKDMCDSWEF